MAEYGVVMIKKINYKSNRIVINFDRKSATITVNNEWQKRVPLDRAFATIVAIYKVIDMKSAARPRLRAA